MLTIISPSFVSTFYFKCFLFCIFILTVFYLKNVSCQYNNNKSWAGAIYQVPVEGPFNTPFWQYKFSMNSFRIMKNLVYYNHSLGRKWFEFWIEHVLGAGSLQSKINFFSIVAQIWSIPFLAKFQFLHTLDTWLPLPKSCMNSIYDLHLLEGNLGCVPKAC